MQLNSKKWLCHFFDSLTGAHWAPVRGYGDRASVRESFLLDGPLRARCFFFLHDALPLGQALKDLNGIVDGGDGPGGAVLPDLFQLVDGVLCCHIGGPLSDFSKNIIAQAVDVVQANQ